MNKILVAFLLTITCLPIQIIYPRAKKPFGSSKTYTKKTPYAGFGKRSKANGQIKVKSTSCHWKKTKKGTTFVHSYSKSK